MVVTWSRASTFPGLFLHSPTPSWASNSMPNRGVGWYKYMMLFLPLPAGSALTAVEYFTGKGTDGRDLRCSVHAQITLLPKHKAV